MNLTKLIELQGVLDKRIRKEKGLEGQDLVANTFIALQVELAEFANEGRWFKFWSDDQEPRVNAPDCDCPNCTGFHPTHPENPLLEEYVDSLHFFLSLAIQKDWTNALYIYQEQLDPDEFEGSLSEWYLEMTYFLNKSYYEKPSKEYEEKWEDSYGFPTQQYWFRTAWLLFLNIGINGFGFTFDQIEQAYINKNETNHSRQSNGY